MTEGRKTHSKLCLQTFMEHFKKINHSEISQIPEESSYKASNSKGVAIIIANNYDANIVNMRDTNGRMILLDIERNGTIYTYRNIYTPTRNFEQDQWQVFREFTNYLEQKQNEHIDLGGNYNLYMNPGLDKLDTMLKHHDNQNYGEDITSFLEINRCCWCVANS